MKTEIAILTLGVLLLGALALYPYFTRDATPTPPIAVKDLRGEPLMGVIDAAGGDPAQALGKHDFKERPARDDGARNLRWREIASYEYKLPDPDAETPAAGKDQIPPEVKALDGEEIALEGYMMPIRVDDEGRVQEFLLSRFVGGCCFGQMPQMNEWAECVMTVPKGTDYTTMGSVVVVGRLEVGEKFDEYGYVTSLYRIHCREVERP